MAQSSRSQKQYTNQVEHTGFLYSAKVTGIRITILSWDLCHLVDQAGFSFLLLYATNKEEFLFTKLEIYYETPT